MQKKVFQVLIFQDDDLIFYYDPQSQVQTQAQNYNKLSQSHRIQNTLGVLTSVSALIYQIHPNGKTQFKNFKTKEYQFNQFDTINGLKIIMITSVRSDESVDSALANIYENYLNYVGKIIQVGQFYQQVKKICKFLVQK